MEELLDFDPVTWTVRLNREWLMMIPEFSLLIRRDKGSEGDYRGSFRKKARREITWIWLRLSWKSPLFTWSPERRDEEALRTQNAGVGNRVEYVDPNDPALVAAYKWYEQYLHEAVRVMKTYKVMVKSLDKLDSYFEDVDFLSLDSMKRPAYSVTDYIKNIKEAHSAHEAVKRFRAQMMEELRNKVTARNNTTLGKREEEYAFNGRRITWQENAPHHDPEAEKNGLISFIAEDTEDES